MEPIGKILRSRRFRAEHPLEQLGDRRHRQRAETQALSIR